MDSEHSDQIPFLIPRANCEYQSSDHLDAQNSRDEAFAATSSYQVDSEHVNSRQHGNENNGAYVETSESANERGGMDLDVISTKAQDVAATPLDYDLSLNGFQDADHIFLRPGQDKVSLDQTTSAITRTTDSQAVLGLGKVEPHAGLLKILGLEPDLPRDSPSGHLESVAAPVATLAADGENVDLLDENVSSPAKPHSSCVIVTQDGSQELDLQEAGVSEGNYHSVSATNLDPFLVEGTEREKGSEIIETSSFDPSLSTSVQGRIDVPSSVAEEGGPEGPQDVARKGLSGPSNALDIVALDERDVFYSGKIEDSGRNKKMRFIPEASLVKKGSHFIKSKPAATIREKIPDMPLLPRISRTTTQVFFAFLYLLTQREWSKYHSERLSNKMGFFEAILEDAEYPHSVRHLTTKKAFLTQLQQDMFGRAYGLWKEENPGLNNREKKEGKPEPVWHHPPKLPNHDGEFQDYTDVTIPFYLWHIREDQELLALTDLVLKKTEADEKIDTNRAAKDMEPTRLSLRTRQLLRLVTSPGKLLDRIHELRFEIDEMCNDMEAKAPIDPLAPENEEEFVDLYTYFIPKPPEEMAAIHAAEKEKLELEKAEKAANAVESTSEAEGVSDVAPVPNRKRRLNQNLHSTSNKYPIPPSMRMHMAAHKIGQEAKRPPKLSQIHQTTSKIKKKGKQKQKQVTWKKPVRASKLRASEKLAKSFAAHAKYVRKEQEGRMSEEEYDDMHSYSYDAQPLEGKFPFGDVNWDGFRNKNTNVAAQKSYNAREHEEDYDNSISPRSFEQEPADLHPAQNSLPQEEYTDEPQYSKFGVKYYDDLEYDDQEYDDQEYDDQYDDNQYNEEFVEGNVHHSNYAHPGYGSQQTHHNSAFVQPGYGKQQASSYSHQGYSQQGYNHQGYYPQSQYQHSMHQPGYHPQLQYQQVQYPQQLYPQQAYAQHGYGQNVPIEHPQNQQVLLPQPYGQHAQGSQAYSHPQAYEQLIHSHQAAAYSQEEEDEEYEKDEYNDRQTAQGHQGYKRPMHSHSAAYSREEEDEYYNDGEEASEHQHPEEKEDHNSLSQAHVEAEHDFQSPESSSLSERSYHGTPIHSPPSQQQQNITQNPSPSFSPNTPNFQTTFTSQNNNTNQNMQTRNLALASPPSDDTPSKKKIIKLTFSGSSKNKLANFPSSHSAPGITYGPKLVHPNLPTTVQAKPFLPTAPRSFPLQPTYSSMNHSKAKPKPNKTAPTQFKAKAIAKPKAAAKSKSTAGNGNKKRKLSNSYSDDEDWTNFVEPEDSDDENFELGVEDDGWGGSAKKRKRSGGNGSGSGKNNVKKQDWEGGSSSRGKKGRGKKNRW